MTGGPGEPEMTVGQAVGCVLDPALAARADACAHLPTWALAWSAALIQAGASRADDGINYGLMRLIFSHGGFVSEAWGAA